jgi:hypothetical protein
MEEVLAGSMAEAVVADTGDADKSAHRAEQLARNAGSIGLKDSRRRRNPGLDGRDFFPMLYLQKSKCDRIHRRVNTPKARDYFAECNGLFCSRQLNSLANSIARLAKQNALHWLAVVADKRGP